MQWSSSEWAKRPRNPLITFLIQLTGQGLRGKQNSIFNHLVIIGHLQIFCSPSLKLYSVSVTKNIVEEKFQ